ncbi:MAG: winged helix-turn-helix transcriptional regulator [Elusimicrobia bacterium]|nr:winged helix-turn-helix transcriptional regulator [Elusimicrobiota bacterium]
MTGKKGQKLLYELHAQVCSVLSNAKRLEIIDLLRSGEKTAGDLTREMEIPKPNVSQQLTILREKGILVSRREGTRIYYRLSFPKMLKAYDLLRQVLIERLREQGNVAVRIGGKTHA